MCGNNAWKNNNNNNSVLCSLCGSGGSIMRVNGSKQVQTTLKRYYVLIHRTDHERKHASRE